MPRKENPGIQKRAHIYLHFFSNALFKKRPAFYTKLILVWAAAILSALPLEAQADSTKTNTNFIKVFYRDINQAGSEDGGLRDERREQNRAHHIHQPGLDAGVFYKKNYLWSLRASWQGLNDFHYYNPANKRHEDTQRLGEAWVGLCVHLSRESCFSNPVLLKSSRSSAGLSKMSHRLRAGRSPWALDASGLFFTGESPFGFWELRFANKKSGLWKVSLGASSIEREDRARRGLPRSSRIKARYSFANLSLQRNSLFLGFHYGYYRSPGRAGRPDLKVRATLPSTFPGAEPSWTLPTGQSARADADVHYYGLAPEWRMDGWQIRARLFHNYGRLISVDEAGTRIRSSRKSIQGSLAWGELIREWGRSEQARPCSLDWIRYGACLQNAPQNRAWQLSIGGIYATRDRNSADQDLTGFGSLRPSPAILGGGASIFLTGPPVGIERPALQNTQPQGPFSDGGNKPYTEPRYFRDNSDPAPPEYANDGLRMGGMRLSYLFPETHRLRLVRIEAFANYAALRYGIGREAILGLGGRLEHLHWQVFATTASYSPAKPRTNPYTNLSTKAPTRYYSRYQIAVSIFL